MEFEYIHNGETITFDCELNKTDLTARFNEQTLNLRHRRAGSNAVSMLNDSEQYTVYFAKSEGDIHIFVNGEKFVFKEVSSNSVFGAGAGGTDVGGGLIASPMPGTIIKFLVKEGDEVTVDQGLVIVEAMKMENEIRSNIDGVVKKLNFKAGDNVDIGQAIIDLDELE
ncbi:MAG: acetyl-CoA carboxylase biotin carboxyl carrier protein subunit [FCB group bacterium]|nr:acetyl-CoA carboxylase biotin carboxyl carrier protein subunit [FCB group bacterium]